MQNAEVGIRHHVSRLTFHPARFTFTFPRFTLTIHASVSTRLPRIHHDRNRRQPGDHWLCLVAIIGVLPYGMNVQKDNREETIINQEATVLMNAIRSGAQGMDDLTNYVVAITMRSLAT